MTIPSNQPVPVARIFETTVIRNLGQRVSVIGWCSDSTIAPATWFSQRQRILARYKDLPGQYHLSSQLIDAATGDVIESHEESWITQPPEPEAKFEPPKPERPTWQRVLKVIVAAPGGLALIASLPLVGFALLSIKAINFMERMFDLLQSDDDNA
jgi:hypothetical protein